MGGKLVVIAIILFAVAAGTSSLIGRNYLATELNAVAERRAAGDRTTSIEVTAEAVPLHTGDPSRQTVGALRYVAGWILTSESEDFGGFSGLAMRNSTSLLAISDKGVWLEADFDLAADQPVINAKTSLFDPSALEGDKEDFDAESIVIVQDGMLVGFEQNHRIMKTTSTTAKEAPMLFDVGVDLSGMSSNSGLEAIAKLQDGSMVMFAESGRDTKGRVAAWHVDGENAKTLDYIPPENFSTTDAAALPDGSLLLLLRHYSLLSGSSAKIFHITADEIASGVLRGYEIADIRAPFTIDNMEGLDVIMQSDGSARLYLISDDNFSVRQDTLLMVFDWNPRSALGK